MPTIKTRLYVVLLLSLFLTGCTALDLRQANHDLADLYQAKSEAINSERWEQELSVNAALSALAHDAAAQGAAKGNAQLNRIAFYRVAATAAWQAGDPKVVQYATEGFVLCTADNYPKAPRDCGMLSVIPGFASVDELTKKINDLKKRARGSNNPPTEQEIVQLYDDVQSRIGSLLKNRGTIQQSSAHPKLIQEIDRQIGAILCHHLQNVSGLIVQVAGMASPAHKKAQCKSFKLQLQLKQLGFTQQIAPCLPPGAPTDPGGCQ